MDLLTVTLLMDTRKTLNNVVLVHVVKLWVMVCFVSKNQPFLVAIMMMETEISALDLNNMVMIITPVEKLVTTIHTLPYKMVVGVLVIIVMETLMIHIIKEMMLIVVKQMLMVTVWVEDGLMLSIPTINILKKMTLLILAVIMMMETEISIMDLNNMGILKKVAEKLAMIMLSLLSKTMDGALVMIAMVLPVIHIINVTTMIVEMEKVYLMEVDGLMQFIQIIYGLKEI